MTQPDSNGGKIPEQLSAQSSVQSKVRQHRAAAARMLLALHQAGQLAKPESWTWNVIDVLPGWCLQDEQSRNQLQLLCGALILAPELRLWIDRELILAAHLLIGKTSFDCIVAKADLTPVPVNTKAASRFTLVANRKDVLDSIRAELLQAGASVLSASLHADLPVDMLSSMLGETAGSVSYELANKLLAQAEKLLQDNVASSAVSHQADTTINIQPPSIAPKHKPQTERRNKVFV